MKCHYTVEANKDRINNCQYHHREGIFVDYKLKQNRILTATSDLQQGQLLWDAFQVYQSQEDIRNKLNCYILPMYSITTNNQSICIETDDYEDHLEEIQERGQLPNNQQLKSKLGEWAYSLRSIHDLGFWCGGDSMRKDNLIITKQFKYKLRQIRLLPKYNSIQCKIKDYQQMIAFFKQNQTVTNQLNQMINECN